MKKLLAIFAIVASLSVGTVFTTAYAFGDTTGLDEVFAQQDTQTQQDDTKLFGRLKRQMSLKLVMDKIANRLRLTEEQRAEIRQIFVTERPKIQAIALSAYAVHQQIKPLGTDGVYNEAEVTRLATLQAQNAKAAIIEKEFIKAQIFAILTPEQRAEAEKIRDEFEAKIQQRIMQGVGNFQK
ncbi:MAG: Spy/CpxP family protein refolding chaperone [Pyrinomonadaceae bacterium]|nr:Spy/CpxP family protein refolding chaperone [Pyrinomonadaceae bacterium]